MSQRILVVDDELGPRESFRMLLKDRFEVHTAASGSEGLSRILADRFDVVFLDIRMPGMGGMEVLRELRQHCPALPVILCTAYAEMETAIQAIEMGALDCLIKPFHRRDVDRLIVRALAIGASN